MPARTVLVIAFATLFAPSAPFLFCQNSSPSPVEPNRPVIHTSTREVLLDLVVRDKHHHAVTDLRPDEVEIYEDGVRQKIRVFNSVQGKELLNTERADAEVRTSTGQNSNHADPQALNSLRQVNFVTVVFAEIAPLNLEFAQRAVL